MENKSMTSVRGETKLKRPKLYAVTMYNDDYTTMDFVVEVLTKIFHKSTIEATNIMMEIHNSGKAVVGVFTYDIAATKKLQTDHLASDRGFPLKLTIDEAME